MTPDQRAAIARDIDSLQTQVRELRKAVEANPAPANTRLGKAAHRLGAVALDRPWLSATLFSLAGWAAFARAAGSVQARLSDRKHR